VPLKIESVNGLENQFEKSGIKPSKAPTVLESAW
jgi:hypothetical protein